METEKKNRHVGLIVFIIIVLLVVVGGYYLFLTNITKKTEKLLNGSTAQLTYKIVVQSNASENVKKTYTALKKNKMAEGEIFAEISKKKLYLSITPKSSDIMLSDFYVDEDDVYMNVEQVYDYMVGKILKDHKLLSLVVPKWEIPAYIKKSQLDEILMNETNSQQKTFMANLPDSALAIEEMVSAVLYVAITTDDFQYIEYTDGNIQKYRYYSVSPELTKGKDVVIGVLPSSLYKDKAMYHIIITDKDMGIQLRLRGSLEEGSHRIEMPKDVMSDKALKLYKEIRTVVSDLLSK